MADSTEITKVTGLLGGNNYAQFNSTEIGAALDVYATETDSQYRVYSAAADLCGQLAARVEWKSSNVEGASLSESQWPVLEAKYRSKASMRKAYIG